MFKVLKYTPLSTHTLNTFLGGTQYSPGYWQFVLFHYENEQCMVTNDIQSMTNVAKRHTYVISAAVLSF